MRSRPRGGREGQEQGARPVQCAALARSMVGRPGTGTGASWTLMPGVRSGVLGLMLVNFQSNCQ
jgi:hypothetical protein